MRFFCPPLQRYNEINKKTADESCEKKMDSLVNID